MYKLATSGRASKQIFEMKTFSQIFNSVLVLYMNVHESLTNFLLENINVIF